MPKKLYLALGFGALLAAGGVLASRIAHRMAALSTPSDSEVSAGERSAAPLQIAETIYDGNFATGWEDWGWGRHELPKQGPAKIFFGGYGGIVLHHLELNTRFGALSFRYKSPADWPEFLAVSIKRTGSPDSAFPQVVVRKKHVAELADGWHEVLIDFSELNPTNLPIERITIGAYTVVPSAPVLLDKIVLTKAASSGPVAPPPAREEDLTVLCQASTQPINPLIYGATGGEPSSGLSAQRIGGNPTTRLNWDAGNLWNTGSDWFFENGTSNGTIWEWIAGGAAHGLSMAVTVPMIGWVSKDATSVGFPWSKISGQRKRAPNRPEAGDGFRPDGSPIRPGPPSETSVAAPPEVIERWVRTLRDKDRASGKRSVQMYLLDNEPSLWNETHRDVHPDPVGYDELLDRTIRYATAIRRADPDAVIAGPTEWGWKGYLYSAKDREAGFTAQPDRRAHGGVPLVPWYLQRLAEYEKTKGVRLLNVLDVHYYPAADGIYGAKSRQDPEGVELRLRSTRSLWDPNYLDESWIKDQVRLIPRLKQWVADNYPGTSVSIGEWSFGGDNHISGALATAEALGRFGQQGLDSAFFYGGPVLGTPVYWAFRAYRNYDGQGGRFLDVSLQTQGAEKVSLFASRDESGSRIVAILVNRDPVFAVRVKLALDGCAGSLARRRIFAYADGFSSLKEDLSAESADAARVELAPYSLTVVEIPMVPAAVSP